MNIIETNLKFNSNHSNRKGAPKGIILHHAAAKSCTVEDVHRWHLANDWAGIGYHFFIRKDGSVYRGRPENWIGAHTVGYNDYIGICCEGNFETDTMHTVQENAVAELLKYLREKYGKITVSRHKDHDATACPGKNYPFSAILNLLAAKENGNKEEQKEESKSVNYVLDFQKALISAGYSLSKYGADGIWGEETAAAATKAQIGNGSMGTLAKFMQNMLIVRGYTLPKYGADGIIGSESVTQIKAFQKASGISVDGICGINTWKKLLRV